MEEKISIIVPVYNAATTLERCVDALIKQTYQNIEIILVNDGSQDDSSSICHRYANADERITVIDKENGGVSSARNAGLDVATGEYVMFCDSDDWAEADWCEIMLAYLEPNCIPMCGTIIEGQQPYYPNIIKANDKPERYKRSECYKLKAKMFNVPWNKIFVRSVIEDNCLRFNTFLTNGEDQLFNIDYLNCVNWTILLLDKCIIHYSWPKETSLSKSVPDNYCSQVDFLCGRLIAGYSNLGIASDDVWNQIYTDIFNEYMKGLLPILNSKTIPFSEKKKRIKRVVDSDNFGRCVERATVSPNKMYTVLWKKRIIIGLMCWHMMR